MGYVLIKTMISYKMAKALKEAGYPDMDLLWYDDSKGKYVLPDLSELIEAVMGIILKHNDWEAQDREDLWFFQLAPNIFFQGDTDKIGKVNEWRATLDKGTDLDNIIEGYNFFGETPKEAVSKLWLKLNKKV